MMIKATNGVVTGELKKATTAITRKNPDNVKVRVRRDHFYVVDKDDFYYTVGLEFPYGDWSEVQDKPPAPSTAEADQKDESNKKEKKADKSNK